jgi:uncharacterized membrane-anchored protein YitT (DUF2179 family)
MTILSIKNTKQGLSWAGIRKISVNLALLSVGSILCAIAINGILIPQRFLSSGLSGLSLVMHYLYPSLPVAVIYALLNIPIFILGWKSVGKRFFSYSLAGAAIFSAALAWVHVTLPNQDMLSGAILAGIINGIGCGIVLRSLGSAGGTDILAVALFKRFSISLGTTTLAFNAGVLAVATLFFPLESVIYTLIFITVNSRMLDLVVYGLSQRKAVMIVSGSADKVARKIMTDIHRGVTILHGEGAYTGRKENILYTVVSHPELSKVKRLINEIDPNAFVVVNDTLEVMGHKIGNQPIW